MIDKGRRVHLQKAIPFDALRWRNNSEISRWCRQYSDISQTQHERWLAKIESDDSIHMFGIINKFDEVSIGVCGLTSLDRINQKAEFSLYISPDYQNLGLGKEALLTLLEHGFMDFNLNRIWGESFQGNPALKIFDKVGMLREGCFRESYFRNGEFIDSIVVSMTRHDWKERYGGRP